VADWFVYVIRCRDDSLYTGVTTDVARRFAEHSAGGARAARYLRGRGPLALVFSRPVGSRSEALSLERRIKSWPRERKLLFIADYQTGATNS
jgi:putative endonuclease